MFIESGTFRTACSRSTATAKTTSFSTASGATPTTETSRTRQGDNSAEVVYDYWNWFHIVQDDCELKIKHVMNMHLKVTREIPLTKVERLWNGPSLRGVKPVLVCFQLFKDKEEVLRKSNMLLKVEL